MLIEEMTVEECREVLTRASLARLACEMDGQPYVIPVYLAYDGSDLFGFATMGYKIDCMRANPLVCVEIDDIKSQSEWMSVVVFGTYEELPDIPELQGTREHAYELLKRRAMWWEPASVSVANLDYPKSFAPIFYRIRIDRMTGHQATPDRVEVDSAQSAKRVSRLSRWLVRVRTN